MGPADAYMRMAKITAGFCASAGALYSLTGVEPSGGLQALMSFAPTLAVMLWLERDAARTGTGSVFDLGFLLWQGWAIAIPWYAWKTRGPRGWRLIVWLFALMFSAYLGQILGVLLALPFHYIAS